MASLFSEEHQILKNLNQQNNYHWWI